MASTILSDNGVSSGSAGIKTTADSTGALALQTTTAGGAATIALSLDTSQNLSFNSGYGSVATAYGCRAWVNFNGTTASPSTIRGSGNVSSVTKNGTGDYTINFNTALVDANYSTVGMSSTKSGTEGQSLIAIEWTTVPSTTVVRITTVSRVTGTAQDNTYNNVAIFR